MLMALLLPDPCDPHCPEEFKKETRRIFFDMYPRPPGWTTEIESDQGLRKIILSFIADFANWDLAANRTFLKMSRALVKAAHGEEAPLVADPFAGGGSIPLEAVRLGCEAFASDLNPVAYLILKVMLEDIPRQGPRLAEELRMVGGEIKRQAERELAELYPADPDGATPIAYLWARTVRCEAPNCGAEIPLLRSFWLCKKAKRKRALRHRVERPSGSAARVEFEVFEPKARKEVRGNTVNRARATCLCCGATLLPERVRAQLAAQQGGADVVFDDHGHRTGGARMTTVVTLRPGQVGRHYRPPTQADYVAVLKAQERVTGILHEWERGGKQALCPVPDEPLPPIGTLGFRVQRYGMLRWGDLFTARQKAAFTLLSKVISSVPANRSLECLLAMICTKLSDRCNSLVNWSVGVECPNQLFKGNAIPIGWDFAESNILSNSSASIVQTVENLVRNAAAAVVDGGTVSPPHQADAADHLLPDETASVWFTDPPYYNAVSYSDLSDFFLVWFKRTLAHYPPPGDPFDPDNRLSPKLAEAVQDETKLVGEHVKDSSWFEETMARCFEEGRRVLREDGVGSIVFAHKTTEGWEALLAGMIRGGWTITASWPIATERYSRLRARDSAALATSIHLVCRPRPDDAPVGEWADVLRELSRRVADWMERLQGEGIRGADLVFACVGPSLEVFSRYQAVESPSGRLVELAEYLEKVWEVVGRVALRQVLGAAETKARSEMEGALEEDARLTALFLWTLQSTLVFDESAQKEQDEQAVAKASARGFSLPFDVVRRFAQPMGIDLSRWTGRLISQKKGVVRLLPVKERIKELFGNDGASVVANWIESDPGVRVQRSLFPEFATSSKARTRRISRGSISDGDAELQMTSATTLDRLHAAMLFQANGHANALRKLIGTEQDRGPDFLRLANALSALYPRGSQEKRLLDAMLLAVPR